MLTLKKIKKENKMKKIVLILLAMLFTASVAFGAQNDYPVSDSPAMYDYDSNTYTELGWADEPVVGDDVTITDVQVSYTWDTDSYAYEGSFHLESPSSTAAEIASGQSDGTYNISMSDFNGESSLGTWKIWIEDSYGDGGHQATGITVSIFYTQAGAPGEPTNPSPADDATDVAISGDLTWDFGADTDTYDLWFGEAGSMTEVVTGAAVVTGTYAYSGLSSATEYEWQVIAHNSAKATTNGPVWSFTTLILPITSFPYSQSFDGVTFAPTGWLNTKTAGTGTPGIWDRQTTGSSPSCSPHSGAAMARYNCFSLSSGTTAELTTLPINFPDDDYRVKFWMYRDTGYSSTADLVNVYYSTSNTSVGATLLGTVNRSTTLDPVVASAGWYEYTFAMPAGAGGDGRFIIFEAVSAYGNNIFFDDVTIEETPTNPVFNCSPSSKDFGTVSVGSSSAAQTFTIENTGGGTLTITGVSKTGTNENQFTLTDLNSYPHDLTAGQSITVDVAFAPTSIGAKTADLSVESSAKVTHTAALSGTGINYNYGQGVGTPLYYFANSTTGASGAPSQPSYSWYANQTGGANEGTLIADTDFTPSEDDGNTDPMGIFDDSSNLTFFGNNYNLMCISTNGTITFVNEGGTCWYSYSFRDIPSTTGSYHNMIAWCWDDLEYDSGQDPDVNIRISQLSDRTIVTFWHYPIWGGGTANSITAQVIIYKDGRVFIMYNDDESTYDQTTQNCAIGIENIDGTAGVGYRYNQTGGPMFGSNLALAFGTDPNTLPVEILAGSFNALYTINDAGMEYVTVNWSTVTETDINGFNIYRSTVDDISTAGNHVNTSLIPGYGTTTEIHDYAFEDITADVYSTYYYWLEVVEINGQQIFHGPVTFIPEEDNPHLADIPTTMLFGNYPNPVTNNTTIRYQLQGPLADQDATIYIYNILGELVRKVNGEDREAVLDVSELPTGIYFYKLETDTYHSVKKMIIVR